MPFGSLWLPVLASAAAVFVASSLVHMVLRYHKADYRGLPNEEDVRAAMRKETLPPGYYVVPYCADPSQMKDPAVAKKYTEGPVAVIAVMQSALPRMGLYLGQWFGFCLLSSFVVGYVARHTLGAGADPLAVMRVTGSIAFAIYGLGALPDSIWRGIPWSNTGRSLIDAAIYALVTGLIFRLLWPA